MTTQQPVWKLLANLGDAHPVDYGGYFVFEDETGVYPPEAEYLDSPDSDNGTWTVHRFVLDRCTLIDGILSDNPYHLDHAAWFATPESCKVDRPQDTTYLSNVASFTGIDLADLQRMFCSESPVDRANAYRMVGDYHGWDNLDNYPLTFTDRAQVESRYEVLPLWRSRKAMLAHAR